MKFNKILAITLTSGLILTGCSQISKISTTTEEVAGKFVKNKDEDIIKKFYTNFSEAKSYRAKTDFSFADDKQNLVIKTDYPFIQGSTDIDLQVLTSITNLETKEKEEESFHIIKKDNTTYAISSEHTSNTWIKTTNPESSKELIDVYTGLKEQANLLGLKELFKDANFKISVTEIDGKYNITYKEFDEKAQFELAKIFDKNTKKLAFNEEYEIKLDGSITFVVNKETFDIESFSASATSKNPSKPLNLKVTSTFTDVNKISEVKLPQEAKNAIAEE